MNSSSSRSSRKSSSSRSSRKSTKKSIKGILRRRSSSSSNNGVWRNVEPKLRVKFNPAKNKTKKYSLGSSERREKIEAFLKPRLKECDKKLEFPCTFRGARLDNMEELKDFIEMNAHKSDALVNKHLNETRNRLFAEGTYAKRIPKEYRLYSHDTGKIYDIRDYVSSK